VNEGCSRRAAGSGPDSTHVLGAIRALNRLEPVSETVRHALGVVAAVAPAWLRAHAAAGWVARYGRRAEEGRLPKRREERKEPVDAIGADGTALLPAVDARDAPVWLREVPAVETLRRVWVQKYPRDEEGAHWRDDHISPASQFISRPPNSQRTIWIARRVRVFVAPAEGRRGDPRRGLPARAAAPGGA
jgi:transposase